MDVTGTLRDYFEGLGCKIDQEEGYHDSYGVDFEILRLQGVHSSLQLALRVTTVEDDAKAQNAVLRAIRLGVFKRAVYVEVVTPHLDRGAMQMVYVAVMAFAFDRRHAHFKTCGLRVFEDSSFHYFDLVESVRRIGLREEENQIANGVREDGSVIYYDRSRGFGFIEQIQTQEKFFFHVSSVDEDELTSSLYSLESGDKLRVSFVGSSAAGKKYPKALAVTLSKRSSPFVKAETTSCEVRGTNGKKAEARTQESPWRVGFLER